MFSGPVQEKTEEQKCSFLLLWIGDKGWDISDTWTMTEDDDKLLKTYYDGFAAYLMPKANPVFARYQFHEKIQGNGESFELFVIQLKLLVKGCDYANSDNVFATNSPKDREKLLSQEPELTLDKAVDIACSYELAQLPLKAMASDRHEVHAVHQRTDKTGFVKQANRPKESQKWVVKPVVCVEATIANQVSSKGEAVFKVGKYCHFAKVCRFQSHTTPTIGGALCKRNSGRL